MKRDQEVVVAIQLSLVSQKNCDITYIFEGKHMCVHVPNVKVLRDS